MPPCGGKGHSGLKVVEGVVGLAGGVLEFPLGIASQGPCLGVGDVGVVGKRVKDVKGIRIDEVVSESGVVVGVGSNRGHDISHVGGGISRLDSAVVGIEDTQLVGMCVTEERRSDSVIETINDLVEQISGSGEGLVISRSTSVYVLDEPDGVVLLLCLKEVVDQGAEHAGWIHGVRADVGIHVQVVPDVTVKRDDGQAIVGGSTVDTQAAVDNLLSCAGREPVIVLPSCRDILIVVFLLNSV